MVNPSWTKALLGGYFVATDEVKGKKSCQWLKQSSLKKEKERMLMVTQEQELRISNTGRAVDENKIEGICRMCEERW